MFRMERVKLRPLTLICASIEKQRRLLVWPNAWFLRYID